MEYIEKIKAKFDEERAILEIEKANILKRVEDVEAQLKPVTGELSGLKQHISQMPAAIFGKFNIQFIICVDISLTHPTIHNIYSLTRLATLVQKT